MKVNELIEVLQKMPQELEVILAASDYDVDDGPVKEVILKPTDPPYVQLVY